MATPFTWVLSATVGSEINTRPEELSTVIPDGRVPTTPQDVPSFLTVIVLSVLWPLGLYDTTNLSVVPVGVTDTEPSTGVSTLGAEGVTSFLIFLNKTST